MKTYDNSAGEPPICSICGERYIDGGAGWYHICGGRPKEPPQYGWICPKCGGVYSPIQLICPHCAPKPETSVTWSTKIFTEEEE